MVKRKTGSVLKTKDIVIDVFTALKAMSTRLIGLSGVSKRERAQSDWGSD